MIDRLEQTEFAINLMQHLVTATFVLDPQGKVLIWNHACERLTGIPASEIIGTRDHWKGFYSQKRPCLADVLVQDRTTELGNLYDAYANPSIYDNGYRAENWCVMPRIGKRLYLAVDAGPIYDKHGELIAVVQTIRDQTDQRNAQTKLEEMAVTDGLTGLYNRRYFNDQLESEWRRCNRSGEPLSLIMLDIDFFKPFNDTYGHLVGDECLKSVAGTIRRSLLRGSDLPARYGGEEFCVLLPNTHLTGADTIARRICANIEHLGIPHNASGISRWVTLSGGIAACIPSVTDNPKHLIEQADKALYRAKASGRNRTVSFSC